MMIIGRFKLIPAVLVAVLCVFAAPVAAAVPTAAANPEIVGYWSGIEDEDNRVATSDLIISRMQIEISQRGAMIDTTIEAVLSNRSQNRDAPVEARFGLGLPAQAVVTGYALDIGGVMVAGTLLDQPKARRVYENEVRKGIDPGLAEISGNMFRTRVYPIAPQGSRTIRVSFSAPANAQDGFMLPLQGARIAGPVTVRYSGSAIRGAPRIALPWGGTLAVQRVGAWWKGEVTSQASTSLTGPLRVAGFESPTTLVVSQHGSRQTFFELAGGRPKRAAPTAASEPGRLRIYWDRSWSRADDRLDTEMGLLEDYLAARPAAAIDLVSFAEDAPVVTSIANAAGLRAALQAQRYLGATRLTGLDALKLAAADTCLLFTDGARTLDPAAEFAPDCRLQVITSAADADTAFLSNLAQDSGGQLLILTADNRAQAAAALARPGAGVVRVRSASGRRISFRSMAVPGGGWHIVGPMADEEGVRVWIAGDNGRVSIEQYDRDSGVAERHDGAGALWAAGEVARLADDPLQRDNMVKLARKYQVASASLAFLVLEGPEQYVAADVEPPKGGFDDEWRANYREMRKDKDGEAQEAQAEHLDMVRRNWAERKAWSTQQFNANAKPKRVRQNEEAADGADAAAVVMAPPPPPPPPSPPLPSPVATANAEEPAAEAVADEADRNIVVSGNRIEAPAQSLPVAISATSVGDAKIEVADLLSDGPYIKALDAAPADAREAVLLEQAKLYGTLPGFWLDIAEWYRSKGDDRMAARLLLTALDAPTADDETRQIVAFRLQRDGQIELAVALLEQLAVTNAERPQPHRLLALALAQRGKPADLERAFSLLTGVALTPFNSAFEGIEVVSLMEANALIPRLDRDGLAWELAPEFVALVDTDVRIVIEWTNDDADIDLWVVEPNGERVYYSHKLSAAGGTISNDMTDGYGPEEYVVRRASQGDYQVRIHGYSPDRINPNGTGRVTVRLIRDFGRPTQRDQLVDAEIGFKDADGNGDGSRAIAKLTVPKAQQKE